MHKSAPVLCACLLFGLVVLINAKIQPSCMGGRSLTSPSAQPGLVNCPQYRDQACCSVEQDSLIVPNANGTQLYGFNWNRCGNLSTACQRFFQAESCYFECDPYQSIYADPTGNPPEEFNSVPVCASYCNAWFDACKNDKTCGVEWLYDFVPEYDSEGNPYQYVCAEGSDCKTFAEVYENPQGLCDLLWSAPFHYSEDEENCIVWDFALTTNNPNQYVEKVAYQESLCDTTYTQPYPTASSVEREPSCLNNRELSTPSSQSLMNCPNYADMSCCGPKTDKLIAHDDPAAPILGYDWTACGPLSPQCEKFFIQQACYYECDPYQAPWVNPVVENPSTFVGVPICASYCDAWFDACIAETTCGVEWIVAFAPILNQANHTVGYTCAPGTKCATMNATYTNGRGLCDMMFGSFYHYSEDTNNCINFDFTGSNPNKFVQKLPYAEGLCPVDSEYDSKTAAIIALAVLLSVTVCLFVLCAGFVYYREKHQRPLFGNDTPMKKMDS